MKIARKHSLLATYKRSAVGVFWRLGLPLYLALCRTCFMPAEGGGVYGWHTLCISQCQPKGLLVEFLVFFKSYLFFLIMFAEPVTNTCTHTRASVCFSLRSLRGRGRVYT